MINTMTYPVLLMLPHEDGEEEEYAVPEFDPSYQLPDDTRIGVADMDTAIREYHIWSLLREYMRNGSTAQEAMRMIGGEVCS